MVISFNKIYFLFSFSLISLACFGQTEISKFEHVKNTDFDILYGFGISNEAKSETGIFLIDHKQIHAYALDEKFEVFRKIELTKTDREYKNIIGQIANDKGYTLFFENARKNRIPYVTFDFEKGFFSEKSSVPIELKGKDILSTFTDNDTLYLLSLDTKKGALYLNYGGTNGFSEKEFDLTSFDFLNRQGKTMLFHKRLNKVGYKLRAMNLDQSNYPIMLSENAAVFKMYRDKKILNLVLDNNPNFTQILTIDIQSLTINFQKIEKPHIEKGITRPMSNSHLSKNLLSQIVVENDSLKINIKDIVENQMLFQTSMANNSIDNQPSKFYQKKSWKENNKEINKSQFFRKLNNNHNPSIVLNEDNGFYFLSFGGWDSRDKTELDPALTPLFMFGAVGGLFAAIISESFNAGMTSYNTYFTGKTIFTNKTLNKNFKVENETIDFNHIFKQIDSVIETQDNGAPMLLFKHNNEDILGIWSSKDETMSLIKL